jgi:hypothetical protein
VPETVVEPPTPVESSKQPSVEDVEGDEEE